jgi:hypothetical protein
MVLTEQFMRNILRPPPTDVAALPPNPPHPFQKSFSYYFKQRFLKSHTPLLVGYAFSIWVFMQLDSGMKGAKKKSFDEAVAKGESPFGHH